VLHIARASGRRSERRFKNGNIPPSPRCAHQDCGHKLRIKLGCVDALRKHGQLLNNRQANAPLGIFGQSHNLRDDGRRHLVGANRLKQKRTLQGVTNSSVARKAPVPLPMGSAYVLQFLKLADNVKAYFVVLQGKQGAGGF
jgi:hypothetical protein